MAADNPDFDVAIVGGGPAGLAAALTLSQARVRAAVFESPAAPRNAASASIASIVGRDQISPADLRAAARKELAAYGTATCVDEEVVAITGEAATGFSIRTAAGRTVGAGAVILACGMVDIFPTLDGLDRHWGASVINCPYCQGFARAGGHWGIYANRPEMVAAAEIYRTWTAHLTYFMVAGAELPQDRERALRGMGAAIERRHIAALEGTDTLSAVRFEDGDRQSLDTLVLLPQQRQSVLVTALNLSLRDDGSLAVDAAFRTSRTGIYAAGDLVYQGHQNVNTALHGGNLAATIVVMDRATGVLAA